MIDTPSAEVEDVAESKVGIVGRGNRQQCADNEAAPKSPPGLIGELYTLSLGGQNQPSNQARVSHRDEVRHHAGSALHVGQAMAMARNLDRQPSEPAARQPGHRLADQLAPIDAAVHALLSGAALTLQ